MWYKLTSQNVQLYIFAKPNAKKTALVDVHENELHIALHAKPHQGEANTELVSFLAKLLRISKSQIILHKGEGSRHKQVIVPLTDSVQRLLDDPCLFLS